MQEQKSSLQEQMQQMSTQLNALLAQQAELNGRNATLERILNSQQQQLELLNQPEVIFCHLYIMLVPCKGHSKSVFRRGMTINH